MDAGFDVIGKNMIITMDRELDHHNAENIRDTADKYIYKSSINNIIFDFENTVFMDSSGIGVIVGRYKLVSSLGGRISVVNVNHAVDRILLLSGLYKLVKKYDSLEEALENESFARVTVASFATQLDPTLEEVADIKTAVSEAVTNSIIHGYGEREGIVYVDCSYEDRVIEIIIRDEGKGIENIEKAREPMFTTKPECERSGMGFTFMEIFMDYLDVSSNPGKGTTVKMKKIIGKVE